MITINVANTEDNDGIKTIVYFIKLIYYGLNWCKSYFEYADVLPIRNITIPAENLSSKLYIPNTNAPVFAFVPTTSEMKFIPVDSTIVWDTPT